MAAGREKTMVNILRSVLSGNAVRVNALAHLAFGLALAAAYAVALFAAVGLPLITVGSVATLAIIASACVQLYRPPSSRRAVWAYAALDMALFSYLIWSMALLYYGKVPAALEAPTYLFLFPLLALYLLHFDHRLILLAGGILLGGRVAIDIAGIVAGGTFTVSYYWAMESKFISIAGEIESLLAITVYVLVLALIAFRMQQADGADTPLSASVAPQSAPVAGGSGRTHILIAEDSAVNMMVIGNMLSDSRFQLIMTEDGREAVETFRRMAEEGTPPDIILLDIEMPEMDGHEAARQIRAMEGEFDLFPRPVIAVTALGNEENRAASLAAGMDDHLVKPVQRPVLLAAITHALARRRNRNGMR